MRNIEEGVNRSAILSTFSHLIHPVVSASVYGYERLTSTGVSSLIHWLIRKHEQIEIRLTGKYFFWAVSSVTGFRILTLILSLFSHIN